MINQLVAKGLRAQLKMGNFVTGQLIVDLDFREGVPPVGINYSGLYPELPTIAAPLSKITNSLSLIVEKFEKLPIEEIGQSLQNTVSGAERLVNSDELKKTMTSLNETLNQIKMLIESLDSKTDYKIGETLDEVQRLLKSAESVLKNGSPLQQEVQETLNEISQAARSIRNAAETLERHPDAFIYGKDEYK
ncbi:MAG: hypothetical protein P8179_25160 [Candidatus Thiodiazotropha sp.]